MSALVGVWMLDCKWKVFLGFLNRKILIPGRNLFGIIFDIKKFALHDGPGIRTTIFFKGCPLNCWWCQNPESIKPSPEKLKVNPLNINDKHCEEELFGKKYSVNQLMDEIKKDQIFYDESGGGVTFSGGEPMLQLKFLKEVLKECKLFGIHTIIDTAGFVTKRSFDQIYDYADIILYDLKIIDDDLHRKFTGVSNEIILNNLKYLTDKGGKVIIRIPLIPAITDTYKNLSELSAYIGKLKNVRRIDLLPYNEIAESKYKRFNIAYRPGKLITQNENKLNEIIKYFNNTGLEILTRG